MNYLREIIDDIWRVNWRKYLFIILLIFFLGQIIFNLTQGYVFFPPFELENPITFTRFQSSVAPISISYPRGWRTSDLEDGNHGDLEVIASISPFSTNGPGIRIAYREILQGTLQDVVQWGNDRFFAGLEKTQWRKLPQEEVIIDDTRALWQTFKARHAMGYQVYILDQEKAYIIQMTVRLEDWSPELEDVFRQMVESIQFE